MGHTGDISHTHLFSQFVTKRLFSFCQCLFFFLSTVQELDTRGAFVWMVYQSGGTWSRTLNVPLGKVFLPPLPTCDQVLTVSRISGLRLSPLPVYFSGDTFCKFKTDLRGQNTWSQNLTFKNLSLNACLCWANKLLCKWLINRLNLFCC